MSSTVDVLADTQYGQVRGRKIVSALGEEYLSFYGIPYATPPVGQLRFKVSVNAKIVLGAKIKAVDYRARS